jgi:hypothetical protein
MTFADAVRLGRVSNLPTVWTNALAGQMLAGGLLASAPSALLLIAVSLAYVGGMYLNDAFDAEIDARQRRERPIPSGRVGRGTVFASGYAMLAASVVLLAAVGTMSGTGLRPALAGLGLAAAIVLYNWHHKQNPLGPVVMGLCRGFVYLAAGLSVTAAPPLLLWLGAAALLCHLIGLTYAAKQEALDRVGSLWPLLFLVAPLIYGLSIAIGEPVAALFLLGLAATVLDAVRRLKRRAAGDIGTAVTMMIAAISLLDAMLIAGRGESALAFLAALGFPLTLALQRWVRGT